MAKTRGISPPLFFDPCQCTLFLATTAALAVFAAGAVSGLATITALAIVFATAGFRLAAIATFAVFAGAVSGLATITALAIVFATAGFRLAGFAATACVLCGDCTLVAAARGRRFVRTAVKGENGSQRKECHYGDSENNMVLCHDNFLSVKWLNVPSDTVSDSF
jgi:hypothetical protein